MYVANFHLLTIASLNECPLILIFVVQSTSQRGNRCVPNGATISSEQI